MSQILITGGMGYVGCQLVPRLAEAGYPVRVLLPRRWLRRAPYRALPMVEMQEGTLFDAEALFRAMTGIHTVFHLASAQWWGGRGDLEYIDLTGTQNVIRAARAARVGRLFFLSHIGAEPSAGFHLLRVKGLAEKAVRESGLAYTILRCGALFGEDDRFVNHIAMMLRANPFFVWQTGRGESLLNPLHIHDLTAALLAALEAVDLVDTTLEIGGAEYMSYNELLRTVMRVSHCQRTIIGLPPYLLRALIGLAHLLPLRWLMTNQWFDLLAGNRTAPLGNLYQYTGVRPRRFEDSLLTYMPRRRYGLQYLRYLFSRRKRRAF